MANRLYIGTTLNFFFEGANNYDVLNPGYLDLSFGGPNI
jgi:hypothetical protein